MIAITIFMRRFPRTIRASIARLSDFSDTVSRQSPICAALSLRDDAPTRYNQNEDTSAMIDLSQIDELARRLSSLVPPGLREGREDIQENFKAVLQSGLAKLDLVTREEFDVQRAVLARTREQLETLKQTLEALEAQLAQRNNDAPNTARADTPPQH
jgi:ubiquinone biosynthesis accessory factor UbiK